VSALENTFDWWLPEPQTWNPVVASLTRARQRSRTYGRNSPDSTGPTCSWPEKRMIYIPLSQNGFSKYKRFISRSARLMQTRVYMQTPISQQSRIQIRNQQSATNSPGADSLGLARRRSRSRGIAPAMAADQSRSDPGPGNPTLDAQNPGFHVATRHGLQEPSPNVQVSILPCEQAGLRRADGHVEVTVRELPVSKVNRGRKYETDGGRRPGVALAYGRRMGHHALRTARITRD